MPTTLVRLYAYSVTPERSVQPEDRTGPGGGQVTFTPDLKKALDAALSAARRARMTEVALRLNQTRTSEVRDAVMRVGFERRHENAGQHALSLARRLAGAMDNRSPTGLFLVAAYRERDAQAREVALWIFPRDEAFRFRSNKQAIELLTDIFSRSSTQRKLALFRGRELRNHYLTADVLDFQAGGMGDVAQFWIDRFLDADPSITPQEGTRVLAQALKAASAAVLAPQEREQLHVATIAALGAPQRRWSLESFATSYLEGEALKRFLAAVPNDDTRRSLFTFDRSTLERFVAARIFRIKGDVIVSAPLDQVGVVVKIEPVEGRQRTSGGNAKGERLRLDEIVVDDRLGRGRRGRR